MVWRYRWRALRVLAGLVLGIGWIGCARPVPSTSPLAESPPTRGEAGLDANGDEPQLEDEEP